jgi:protein-tyrosine-phosphatase/DNA-binding transcriptional ArsR family regulator
MNLAQRSAVHAALGDRHRLAMVDALSLGDRTFQELAQGSGVPGNLAAHHLDVLEAAGLIERRVSDGDHRRRYISLRVERLEGLLPRPAMTAGPVLFICTHNSARSQFAAARWQQRTGLPADSAGGEPADRVHPKAVTAARTFGLDLGAAVPKGYEAVQRSPDLLISVCDRAHEAGAPFAAPSAHWSIPDPVREGTSRAFRSAFASIAERIEQLAASIDPPRHDRKETA